MTRQPVPSIPLETLRYLVLLSDGLNFREVADEVGKTRQAIAQAIKAAEKTLNIKLVSMTRQGYILTHQGTRIAVLARKAVKQYDNASKLINAL